MKRTWTLLENTLKEEKKDSPKIESVLHKTIKKVTEDIEKLNFNTAISAMMILINEIYKQGHSTSKQTLKTLSQLLMPFAPHFAEEIWEKLGGEGFVSLAPWPEFHPDLVKEDMITLGVQLNGKTKGTIEVLKQESEQEALKKAQTLTSISRALEEKKLFKVIYKQGKILNLIVK